MKKAIFILGLTMIFFSAVIGQNQFEVLLYTKPNPYHDQAIITAVESFKDMSTQHQFGLTWTQQETSFDNGNIEKFDVIVFLNTNSRFFNEEQKTNIKKFVNDGGGIVGIHGAAVSIGDWEWFKKLIGRVFRANIKIQSGIMNILNNNFPATMHLPEKWLWTEEWYLYGDALTPNQNVLISFDETTIEPIRSFSDIRMENIGKNNPISWYQEFEGGRSFYTALGHQAGAYNDPLFLKHLMGAIYWAANKIDN
jgi:type 1 glutamine amidotransferase